MGWYGDYSSARAALDEGSPIYNGGKHYTVKEQGAMVRWSVFEVTIPGRGKVQIIGCTVAKPIGSNGAWMYKPMSEDMGPVYYSVPMSWFAEVPDPQIGYSTQWREKVMAA